LRIRELLADLERRTADFGRLMEDYISTDLENYRALEPKGTTYKNLIVLGADTCYVKLLAGLAPEQPASLSAGQLESIYRKLLATSPAELSMDYDIPGEHASLLLPVAILIQKFIDFQVSRASACRWHPLPTACWVIWSASMATSSSAIILTKTSCMRPAR